jgi:hypothetical protein
VIINTEVVVILMALLFVSMGLDDVFELRQPTGLLFVPQMVYDCGEPRWNDIDRGIPNDQGENPGLRCEMPASNRLSHARLDDDDNEVVIILTVIFYTTGIIQYQCFG